jgi:osmotically-inducible protein OsmY
MNTQGFVGLEDQVHNAIKNNPYVSRRNLSCETNGGRVVLRGRVQSYFQKQMAQETVRHIDGIVSIENCLEVD